MMVANHTQHGSENIEVIIWKLIDKADNAIRPVISVFDRSQKRETNIQRLTKFKVDILESCAEFLGIPLADKDNFKIYTRDTLAKRIYFAFMALMPAKCGECSNVYTIEHDSEYPPFFSCFRCFKGSHDCERNRELHQALSTMNTPSGFVWLCDTCHGIVDPIDPRKQRSRHVSENKTPSENVTAESSDMSNLALQSALSSTQYPPPQNQNSSEISDSERRPLADTCPRFLNWNCPHGISGKKLIDGQRCSLKHLRVCNEFRVFGSTGRRGCKRQNCRYFHPKVCSALSDTGTCVKRNCPNFHPRSSRKKRSESRNNVRVSQDSNANKKDRKKNETKSSNSNRDSTDFLELRNLVVGMAAKLESLEKKVEQRGQACQPVTQPTQSAPPTMIYPAPTPPGMMSLGMPRLHPHFPYTHQSYY